jgi:hypothetical protein
MEVHFQAGTRFRKLWTLKYQYIFQAMWQCNLRKRRILEHSLPDRIRWKIIMNWNVTVAGIDKQRSKMEFKQFKEIK